MTPLQRALTSCPDTAAAAPPAPDLASSERPARPVLSFCFGDKWFGVGAAAIVEIIAPAEPVPVPGAPAHVRGVFLHRGRVVPLVDARGLLAPDSFTRCSEGPRCLVVHAASATLGFWVDAVDAIHACHSEPAFDGTELLSQPLTVGGRLVCAIHLENLLRRISPGHRA